MRRKQINQAFIQSPYQYVLEFFRIYIFAHVLLNTHDDDVKYSFFQLNDFLFSLFYPQKKNKKQKHRKKKSKTHFFFLLTYNKFKDKPRI